MPQYFSYDPYQYTTDSISETAFGLFVRSPPGWQLPMSQELGASAVLHVEARGRSTLQPGTGQPEDTGSAPALSIRELLGDGLRLVQDVYPQVGLV